MLRFDFISLFFLAAKAIESSCMNMLKWDFLSLCLHSLKDTADTRLRKRNPAGFYNVQITLKNPRMELSNRLWRLDGVKNTWGSCLLLLEFVFVFLCI